MNTFYGEKVLRALPILILKFIGWTVTGLFTMFTHPMVWLLQVGAFINAALQTSIQLPWSDLLEGWTLGAGLLAAVMPMIWLEEMRIGGGRELRESVRLLWTRQIYDARVGAGYEHPWEFDQEVRDTVRKEALLAMLAKAQVERARLQGEEAL
jgi:hypothetical protein